jgi:hypothetical protein
MWLHALMRTSQNLPSARCAIGITPCTDLSFRQVVTTHITPLYRPSTVRTCNGVKSAVFQKHFLYPAAAQSVALAGQSLHTG